MTSFKETGNNLHIYLTTRPRTIDYAVTAVPATHIRSRTPVLTDRSILWASSAPPAAGREVPERRSGCQKSTGAALRCVALRCVPAQFKYCRHSTISITRKESVWLKLEPGIWSTFTLISFLIDKISAVDYSEATVEWEDWAVEDSDSGEEPD